jgi:hypothetical protein
MAIRRTKTVGQSPGNTGISGDQVAIDSTQTPEGLECLTY